MKRKTLGYFEDVTLADNIDDAFWPEFTGTLHRDSTRQDLGLWRLAEESARLAGHRPIVLQPKPRTSPRSPDWPDAA